MSGFAEDKRLEDYSLAHGIIEPNSLVIVDIGAAGGLQAKWHSAAECVQWIGFEPNPIEYQQLLGEGKLGKSSRVYPHAIADTQGHRTFFNTQFPDSSGFIRGNTQFLNRLYGCMVENLKICSSQTLETITLDHFVEMEAIPTIDFIKIDVEGFEHRVLSGATQVLKKMNVLGVESEICLGPIKDPDNWTAIDGILRGNGFFLFDITTRKYPRKTFPRGFLNDGAADGTGYHLHSSKYGQVLGGDVVYLKDPVWELENGDGQFEWTDANVMKMAIIYKTYALYDCAIELLQVYGRKFQTALPIDLLCDFLTPWYRGEKLGYEEYLERCRSLPWDEMEHYRKRWVK